MPENAEADRIDDKLMVLDMQAVRLREYIGRRVRTMTRGMIMAVFWGCVGAAVMHVLLLLLAPVSPAQLRQASMQGMAPAAAPQGAQSGKLRASVSRGYLQLGEVLHLSLVYQYDRGETPPGDDELAPVGGWHRWADFEVVRRSHSQSSAYILRGGNVEQQTQVQWNLVLAAHNSGVLQIPAFEVRGQRSLAMQIPVAAASGPQTTFGARLELQQGDARVGQQLLLRLHIEYGADLRVRAVRLPLDLLDAEVVELPRRNDHGLRDGELVHSRTYSYAIFPRTGGRMEIPRALVSGEHRRRRLVRTTDAISVQVGPPPPAISATAMQLSAQWPDEPLQVGQPAKWSLVAQAHGSAGPPAVDVPQVADMRQYRDSPRDRSEAREQGLVWTRTLDINLVPRASGTLSLPQVEIPWWDAAAGAMRVARLEARRVRVEPSAMNTLAPPAEGTADAGAAGAAGDAAGGWLARPGAAAGAALLLALLLALGLPMAAMRRARPQPGPPTWLASAPARRIRARIWQWRLAGAKTPAAAARALHLWLAAANAGTRNLALIADPGLQADLQTLQQTRFAPDPPQWDPALARRLARALAPVLHPRARRQPPLQPLYPRP